MLAVFTVVPTDRGVSISPFVTRIVEEVDRSGLDYQLTAMGTLVEGDWDRVMALIKKCHSLMRRKADRVITSVTIDDRKGARKRLAGKVASVKAKTKRNIRT